MNSTTSKLTQDELLHLAIESTRRGEHGAAISYLKEGVERFPDDGKLAYVLGAEFAQIGMYEQAEMEMQRAIDLSPELHTASFQLGLLQMTLGKVDEAKLTWTNLNALPADHSLFLFKTGLEQLAAEHYNEARSLLEKGVQLNDFSPELNHDMNNVLLSMPETSSNELNSTIENGAGHVWLSAYNNEDSETH